MSTNRKIHNGFKYVGMLILSLATTQCFERCKPGKAEDTTNITLAWELLPGSLSVDTNLATGTRVCYVPSDNATYAIRHDRDCWKFTQHVEGTDTILVAEEMPKLAPSLDFARNFCFCAGNGQQHFFVGRIANPGSGYHLILYQLEGSSWQEKTKLRLDSLSKSVVGEHKRSSLVTACTAYEQGQYVGYIFFYLPRSNNIYEPYQELFVVRYNPTTNTLENVRLNSTYADAIKARNNADANLQSASILPVPGKLILQRGEENKPDAYDILACKNNILTAENPGITSPMTLNEANNETYSERPTWLPFNLPVAGTSIPTSYLVFSAIDKQDRKFFCLVGEKIFTELPGPSGLQGKETTLLPSKDCVYLIAPDGSDDKGQPKQVVYKGTLQLLPPPTK